MAHFAVVSDAVTGGDTLKRLLSKKSVIKVANYYCIRMRSAHYSKLSTTFVLCAKH
ncbi:hypothetical protein Plhal304r1_c012g0045111 [Plasmopara halstedii]